MFTNDSSESTPRRRRIIQAPLRTEPPIALIGGDGRAHPELEALLKRQHPLISFPSLSHFLAAPPERQAWAAIVMTRASAWDVRLDRYVARRSRIALFAQPEEGYGWPEEVARIREIGEVDAWLERLHAPEPAPILKKPAKPARAPRSQPQPTPTPATPSWLEQDAPVWDALASTSASAESASEPGSEPIAKRPTRRPPEQLALAAIADVPAKPKRGSRLDAREPRAEKRGSAREQKPSRRKTGASSRPRTAPSVRPAAVPEPLAQHSAALVRSVLSEKRPPDLRGELAFLQAAAEVGIVRAEELLQRLHARAATLA